MSGFFAHAPLWHLKGDFWKFWSRQTISTLGSSVTGFALPLLVFKLTNSPLNLALAMVFTVLSYLLFGLAIGAWVDRTNRKRVMVFTDWARALVIASIPLLTVLGLLSVWWIYVVSFVNATLTIGFVSAASPRWSPLALPIGCGYRCQKHLLHLCSQEGRRAETLRNLAYFAYIENSLLEFMLRSSPLIIGALIPIYSLYL
jgi:MFS family permease